MRLSSFRIIKQRNIWPAEYKLKKCRNCQGSTAQEVKTHQTNSPIPVLRTDIEKSFYKVLLKTHFFMLGK